VGRRRSPSGFRPSRDQEPGGVVGQGGWVWGHGNSVRRDVAGGHRIAWLHLAIGSGVVIKGAHGRGQAEEAGSTREVSAAIRG
jgi:hypothetical protein